MARIVQGFQSADPDRLVMVGCLISTLILPFIL